MAGWQAIWVTLWGGLRDALVERKINNSYVFKCRVKIDGIRTRKGWNFPSCGGEKCKKRIVQKKESFWCQACDRAVEYPVLRFRLELDVSDKTTSTVVVMFDEPAKELVKCYVYSLTAANKDVRIASEEVVEEDVGSRNVNTYPDIKIKHSKWLATKPTVATPSKPTEEMGKRVDLEDSDKEVTCGMDDGQADGKDGSVSDKRKKKRYIMEDSTSM
nr:hypothetical protein [Tanacetum cinerariifolium]